MTLTVTKHNIKPAVDVFHKNMQPESPYTLTIKLYRKPRSLNQNSLFHAICSIIASETGMDASLIKEGVKEQYGIKERVALAKEVLEVPKPSHLCDTQEMSLLIDGAIYEAAGLGIDVLIYQQEWEQLQNSA